MRIIDYELIEHINILFHKKVVIYGCGMWGKRVCNLLKMVGITPIGFAETNSSTNRCFDICVCDLNRYLREEKYKDMLIIIASVYYWKDMISYLDTISNDEIEAVTMLSVFYSIHINRNNNCIPEEAQHMLSCFEKVNQHKYYNFICDYFWNTFCDAVVDDWKILVYTPGKVGSRTVSAGLGDRGLHIHTFVLPGALPQVSSENYSVLRKKIFEKKRKMIIMVRSPFSRDISGFLQNMDSFLYPFCVDNPSGFFYGDYLINNQLFDFDTYKRKTIGWTSDMSENCERYLSQIIETKGDEFSWFDYELKHFWDIDVFEHNFDKERGCQIIDSKYAEIMLIKLEKLSYCMKEIFDFIGGSYFYIQEANTGSDKMYKFLYDSIRNKITLPKDYVNYYINNSYAKHFYAEEELLNDLKKWKY